MKENKLNRQVNIYEEIDTWARPLLQELGELEWGRRKFIVTSDPSETGEERGWIVRKLAEMYHYQIGISTFQREDEKRLRFFIRTGGDMIFSIDLTKEALREAINEALKFGPSHLESPGRIKEK